MFSDRPRWLYIVLAISVLLNLFLAGFVIGRLSFPTAHVPSEPGAGAMIARSHVRDLPVMERIRFGLAIREHASELRQTRDRLRDARAEAERAITARTYNEALVKARLADVRHAVTAQQEALHNALADALSTLSPQSRAELVNATKEEVRRRLRARP
jgi:uncharacterized membrane protein